MCILLAFFDKKDGYTPVFFKEKQLKSNIFFDFSFLSTWHLVLYSILIIPRKYKHTIQFWIPLSPIFIIHF